MFRSHEKRAVTALLLPAILAAGIIVAGCGSGDGPADPVAGDTLRTSGTADTETGTTAVSQRATIASVEKEVSAIRELPVKNEIAVSYVNRDQLREEMKAELDKEFDPVELAAEEQLLKELGLLQGNDDLAADIERMLGEEVAGFYDDQTKQLKLVSDTQELTPVNEVTLAHEVTHALQDQNFSLGAVLPENSGNDDLDLARLALVEGDASLTEEDYMTGNFSAFDLAGIAFGSLGAAGSLGTNSYLEDTLMFPYMSGLEFVTAVRDAGGWPAVDAIYQAPPLSTEQVMHPQKYLAREAPVVVELPDLTPVTGPGWELVYKNVMGEFGLKEILYTDLPGSRAGRAAAGWGGDAIAMYRRGDGAAVTVMKTAWDTDADAAEFATAMGEALEERFAEKFDLSAPAAPTLKTPDGVWLLVQKGPTVEVVAAPDQPLAEKVMLAVP